MESGNVRQMDIFLIVVKWSNMATYIWIYISSGNGLLTDRALPLPETLLISHKMGSLLLLLEQFTAKTQATILCYMFEYHT